MKRLLTLLFVVVLAACAAWAQLPSVEDQPCGEPLPQNPCAQGFNLTPGEFDATPLIDGNGQSYGDPDGNIVSLYGPYGNNESLPTQPQLVKNHYQKGQDLADQIVPRCTDGSVPPPNTNCNVGGVIKPPAIVFLFLGFSNCDIEICGGNSDAWDGQDTNPNQNTNPNGHLKGQPCATQCRNKGFPGPGTLWNQVTSNGGDTVTQESFLWKVYHDPNNILVGPHVVVFNGAFGSQTLDKWDPTPAGYYAHHNNCPAGTESHNPECNYTRVQLALQNNGFSEAQVQAIFFKSSNPFPQCDLKGIASGCDVEGAIPDAYQSEIHLGDILRYLKCCTLDEDGVSTGLPRYANLKQVFLTTRIYGGYANGTDHGCLMPEPFAYEEGFAVQRLVVAQIKQAAMPPIPIDDIYAASVDYNFAPWFDWGPYLWASGGRPRNADQLVWCNGQGVGLCPADRRDLRYGDLDPGYQQYWGDFIHPTADGAKKVAEQLVTFIGKTPGKPGSEWVTRWIGK